MILTAGDLTSGFAKSYFLRQVMKQLFSLAFVLPASLCGPLTSFAGPPFGTDDPEPAGFRHGEYNMSSQGRFQCGFATVTLPHFDLNYGLIKGRQIHFELPMNYSATLVGI